jgi:predicted ATP-dependent endonuclease of OLD family
MKISQVILKNIRGYEHSTIDLSPKINLLIGENNSGKTTVLKSLLLLQDTLAINSSDIRINQGNGHVFLNLAKGNNGKYLVPEFSSTQFTYVDYFQYSFSPQHAAMQKC